MKKSLRKKIYLICAFLFLFSCNTKKDHSSKILLNPYAFSRYQGGNIYIGDYSYLRKCFEFYEEGDIFVLDQRKKIDNPTMKVYSSYKINSKDDRSDIIDSILQYEEMNPSMWDRSRNSMKFEWYMHNLSYLFHHRRDRTTDVDFDNKDEEVYDKKILVKILDL